jgi:hypothetical protein
MVSTANARWCDDAVVRRRSIASSVTLIALSQPMLTSLP